MMEQLAAALAAYDARVAKCPYRKHPHPPSDEPCQRCKATAREGCGEEASASYEFIKAARDLCVGEEVRAA